MAGAPVQWGIQIIFDRCLMLASRKGTVYIQMRTKSDLPGRSFIVWVILRTLGYISSNQWPNSHNNFKVLLYIFFLWSNSGHGFEVLLYEF